MSIIFGETRAATTQRHLQVTIDAYRRELAPRLDADQQRALIAFLDHAGAAGQAYAASLAPILTSTEFSADGRQTRAAAIRAKTDPVFARLQADAATHATHVAETTAAVLRGVGRAPTPADRVDRVHTLIMRLPESKRIEVYTTARQRGDWATVDACESDLPEWARPVPAAIVAHAHAQWVREAPEAPTLRGLREAAEARGHVLAKLREHFDAV